MGRSREAHIPTALRRDGTLQALDGAVQLVVTPVADATSGLADRMYRSARHVLGEQFDGFIADRFVELQGRERERQSRHRIAMEEIILTAVRRLCSWGADTNRESAW